MRWVGIFITLPFEPAGNRIVEISAIKKEIRMMRYTLLVVLCAAFVFALPWSSQADETSKDESLAAQIETITVPQGEWEALKAEVTDLRREIEALKAGAPIQPSATESEIPAPPTPGSAETGGRYLSLPDISLIVQAKGKLSSDTRDDARNRVRLYEAELGVQGYVFPNVKADAFIAMSPAEEAAAQAEEAYLTYLGLRQGLNLYVGKKQVAFGRTNLLHCHSLPYVRRPLALQNLVGEEGLNGQGVAISYLLPTTTDLFTQLDLGAWTGEGPGESSELPDILAGPGAGFSDRFNTARLWASHPVGESNELELGGSYARGPAEGYAIEGVGHTTLSGLDLTYRHFGEGDSRLLLRGESVWRHEANNLDGSTAKGYYLFGSYRPDKYRSLGLLYDWSEFPQAPDQHESALSLILTKQFSEQYYLRLQGVHGNRPGSSSYNELWLQWVWGVGPHTHNLE
jgi:hypothetical protein